MSKAGIMIMFRSNFPQDDTPLELFLESKECTDSYISLMNYAAAGKNIKIIKLMRNFCSTVNTENFHQIMISNYVSNDILIKILSSEPPNNIYNFVSYCCDKSYKIIDELEDHILNIIENTVYPTNCEFLRKFFCEILFKNKHHLNLIKKIISNGIDISDSFNNKYFETFTTKRYIEHVGYQAYRQIFEILFKSKYIKPNICSCYNYTSNSCDCTLYYIYQQNMIASDYLLCYAEAIIKYNAEIYSYELIFDYYADDEQKIKILGQMIIDHYLLFRTKFTDVTVDHLKILARYKIINLEDYFIFTSGKKCEKTVNIFYSKLKDLSMTIVFEVVKYIQTSYEKEITKLKTELKYEPDSLYVQSLAVDFKEKVNSLTSL